MDSDNKGVVYFFIFIILTIIISSLLGVSVETINFNEISLNYNHFYETIEYTEKYIKETGRFFIGINNNFLKFPKFYESIEFSDDIIKTENNQLIPDGPTLNCTTSDGIGVRLELNFYFEINATKLKDIYFNFGLGWKNILIKASMESIKNTATTLNNILYFEERNTISKRIMENLQNDFNKLINNGFIVKIIQLRDINFEDGLENSINLKLIQKHNKKLFDLNGRIFNITITTDYIIAKAESQIKQINANSIGNGISHNEEELSKSLESYLKNLNEVYFNLKNSLGVINNSNLYKFLYSMELSNYNFDGKSLLFLPSNVTQIKGTGNNTVQKSLNLNINLKDSIKLESENENENKNNTSTS